MGEEGVAGAAIEGDVACVRCRYNLRTLPAEGRCPECGLPVAVTVSGDGALAGAPAGWIGQLRRGVGVYVGGCVLSVVLGVAWTLLAHLASQTESLFLMRLSWWLTPWTLALISEAVLCWGIWLLTSPQPLATQGFYMDRHARWARTMALAWWIVDLAQSIVGLAQWPMGWVVLPQVARYWLTVGQGLAVLLIWTVAEWHLQAWLAVLARRAGAPILARQATTLKWCLTMAACMWLAIRCLTIGYALLERDPSLEVDQIIGGVKRGLGIGGLFFYGWQFVVLLYFWVMLKRIKKAATGADMALAPEPQHLLVRAARKVTSAATYHGSPERSAERYAAEEEES